MHARHRRLTTGPESDDSFSVITVGGGETFNSDESSSNYYNISGNIGADPNEDKKYSKKWTFTQYTKETIPFIGSITSNISQTLQSTNFSSHFGLGRHTEPLVEKISDLVSDNLSDLIHPTDGDEIEVMMTSRDRTVEFSNAIRSLQGRNIQRAANIRDPKKAKQLQSYSEFMMIAKHIGKNIANTYSKLEKLTLLAKRKSLFDDRPAEIQELTYIIKGDLNSLNQQIARFQEISKSQRKTTNGKHLLSHSSNMVLALQSKLANMSTDFKQILEVRTENLKHQKTRRDQFSQGPISHSLPPSTMRGPDQGSILLSEQDDQVSIDISQNQPLIPRQNQLQQQQMLMYDESDNYVQQRAETMQNIESTIVELGGIFQQLAHMVKEQEEIVERIDTNVQDAEMNIEAAHSEILKYFQSVTKNRWLMIKIFSVVIFFFIFFVMFLT